MNSSNTPIYLATDTAWALAWSLERPEVERYLNDRKAKGFNAVAFLGYPYHHAAGINQTNRYGHKATDSEGNPLLTSGGSPNSPNDYWDHVDYIIDELAARGLFAL